MVGDCSPLNHRDKEAAILQGTLFSEVSLVVYEIDNRHIYPDIDEWPSMVSAFLPKGRLETVA